MESMKRNGTTFFQVGLLSVLFCIDAGLIFGWLPTANIVRWAPLVIFVGLPFGLPVLTVAWLLIGKNAEIVTNGKAQKGFVWNRLEIE